MAIAPIYGAAGRPLILRSRADQGPSTPEEPEPQVLTLASTFIMDVAGPVVVGGTTISIVEVPSYLLNGEPYQPEIIAREWVTAGVVEATGDSYVTVDLEDVFLRERVIDPGTGLEWEGEPAATIVYNVTSSTPGAAPAAPTASDWTISETYYTPLNADTFKPRIKVAADVGLGITGDLDDPLAEYQWTTSAAVPALANEWEPIIPYDGDFTTSHKDGETSTWAYFTEARAVQRTRFRIRWRLNGSDWSDEGNTVTMPIPGALALPATPTGFSVTAGGIDGQVVVACNAQSDWGDGTAGELVLSADPWIAEQTLATGNLQMPEGAEGLSVTFSVIARSSEGLESVAATSTVTVPGTAPALDSSQWARFHFSSTASYNSWLGTGTPSAPNGADIYNYGDGGVAIQFCHGGERSPANPDHAAFWMDVAGPWVTTDAESADPTYQHPTCDGLWASLSSAGKWHPTLENSFLYVAAAGRASGVNEDLGDGLYYTDDLGETMVRLIGRSDLTNQSTYVKGGTRDDLKWRNYFHTVDYDPSNANKWWWVNSDDAIYSSTTGYKGNWSRLSGAPSASNMGRIGYMKVAPGGNTIWIGADTGLWKSSTGGVGFTKQSPTGLPAGRITTLDFNDANYNDFYVMIYAVGLYRTTNGGTSFSKITIPIGDPTQHVVSKVNRSHQWVFGRGPDSGLWYTSNAGSSWTKCTATNNTYGWNETSTFYTVMHSNNTGNQTQCRVLPSAQVASRAIATSSTKQWYTANGIAWTYRSKGYSNTAGGEGVNFLSAVGDRMVCMMFDKRCFKSTNGGKSWSSASFASLPFTDYIGIACDINPQDTNYVITTSGKYTTANSSVVVSTDFLTSAANSFRPSFFTNNYGNQDRCPWAAWHGQNENIAYSVRGKSTNKGTSWTKWTQVETSGSVYASNIGEPTSNGSYYDMRGVWARSPSNGDVLWAFPNGGGKILRSANAGVSWTVISQSGPGEFGQHIYGFEPHPTDATKCYWWEKFTGLKQYSAGTITTSSATNAIKDLEVTSICVNPQNANHIALMNREGATKRSPRCAVFLSTNGMAGPFINISANLPRIICHKAMAVHPEDNYLFVHGVGGAYTRALPGGSAEADFFLTNFGPA